MGTIFIDNSQVVKVQFIKVNNMMVELLEPLNDNSPVCTFLDNHGSGGLYHLAFKVDDLEKAERDVRNKGGIVISKSKDGWNGMKVMFAMYIYDNEKHLVEYVVTQDNFV
jgi:methylmalonyl-CoA epimerase|tara:strand:+ start:554 stop:883 length:330 start_codon:yes stop_codon:yes gene_type:complete